ncbi:MAG: hypothetical protein RMH97_06050 [Verrucomicrobiales bacterium]|nr:hypothetical protein [Verrucomicrobiales bacterium]
MKNGRGQLSRAKRYVEAWQRAGPELERMRLEAIKSADTAQTIAALDGLFESAVKMFAPKPISGLVEQQRLFGRLKQ